jgi:DNA modification methylase
MGTRILQGDARALPLRAESVHMVCTSPPYYRLRDYHSAGQLGHEASVAGYVEALRAVFREMWRVLRRDGTVWLNIGDSYNAAGRHGQGTRIGYLQGTNRGSAAGVDQCRSTEGSLGGKNLLLVPFRVALALQEDGWIVRSVIIWAKSQSMPESVTDRPTHSHEYVFLLAKQERYYYDQEAVREDFADARHGASGSPPRKSALARIRGHKADRGLGKPLPYSGRNLRTIWTLPHAGFAGAHFATFPPALVERCLKAGTSEKGCCPHCGAPWVRVLERESFSGSRPMTTGAAIKASQGDLVRTRPQGRECGWTERHTRGWEPSCACPSPHTPMPCTVLDPFSGAGTTALVADRLGRHGIGVDLSWPYCRMARERIWDDAPLLAGLDETPADDAPQARLL